MTITEDGPRATASPPHARGLSTGASFWMVGYAFTVVMAFATVPTPLYVFYAARDHLSAIVVTCVFAAYAVGVIAALLLAGRLSDWVGRRRMLVQATLLAILAGVIFAACTAVWALLIARALSGFAVGVVTTTATTYLAELHALQRPAASARRAQTLAVAANLGGIGLGSVLSGLLAAVAPDPLRTPYLVADALLVIALAGLAFAPETVTRTGPITYRVQRIAVPVQARAAFTAAALGAGVIFTVFGLFSALVPSFVRSTLHEHSPLVSGAVASAVFIASAAAQLLGSRRRPVHPSIAAAVIAAGLAVLAAGTSLPALALLVLGAVVTGIGAGLLFTSLLARVVALAPPHGQSNILTGFFLAGYIGLALPVVALGALDQLVSASTLMTVFAAVATVLLAAAAVALSRTRDRTRETT